MRSITPQLCSSLQQLEQRLLLPNIRRDARALEALLSEDFREIGASGNVYDRDAIIRLLSVEPDDDRIVMSDFAVTILTRDHRGNEVAMTSYISARTTADGVLKQRARRTSIWMHCDNTWRMRFHQATILP
jgi:hypothetical protein